MKHKFKIGDRVCWQACGSMKTGTIQQVYDHTATIKRDNWDWIVSISLEALTKQEKE